MSVSVFVSSFVHACFVVDVVSVGAVEFAVDGSFDHCDAWVVACEACGA